MKFNEVLRRNVQTYAQAFSTPKSPAAVHPASGKKFTFDPDFLQELERLCRDARSSKDKRFLFHGHELGTDFAVTLIVFLRNRIEA